MKNLLLILLLPCCMMQLVSAQNVTYSEDIAPIIYKNCTSCHRAGEIAPFPLTNYAEVSAWAGMIKYVTEIRYMPPWKPEIGYQEYQKENYLTDAQIQLIADWVADGSPQGDPNLEPPVPIFPSGSQVGTPDLVLSFAESYTHQGNNTDEYRYFVLPTGLTQDKDLVALELRPGNKKIVHHTLIWEDTTGAAAADDAATPLYGYSGNSGTSASINSAQLPGYVPGQKTNVYTNGMAMKLHAGSDLKLQMHYAPTPTDETDSTTINLFFADAPATRFVQSYVMLPTNNILTNGPFIMPPNQVKKFHGEFTVPFNVSLLGIAPHSHLLSKSWEVYAVTPANDTINLIKINDWDFNWQGAYMFERLIVLPVGSVIHAYAEYDNTVNNPLNPNSPPIQVSWGEGTSDEMYYLPVLFLPYQQGDENIVFEDSTTAINDNRFFTVKDELYPVAPNPANDKVKIGFTLATGNNINLKLYDMTGKEVLVVANKQFHLPGLHSKDVDLSNLPSGVYNILLEVQGAERQVQQLVITH